jgi:hypothetical protein
VSKKSVVLLSGTRKIELLPGEVREMIQEFAAKGWSFLVGDAPGSDRAFQRFRNNIGGWSTRFIDSGLKSKTNAMHAAKDREMAEICDLSVAIWDGQSAGTLANVLDVTDQGKVSYLYNFLEQELIKFDNTERLSNYLEAFPIVHEVAKRRLRRDKRRRDKMKGSPTELPDTLF